MRFDFDKSTDWREGIVLLFDKPYSWTSFNLVSKVRSLLWHRLGYKKIKVGHAGTLDPLATGLMIVCVGKATKRVTEFQVQEKEYVASFRLGATTPSFDMETQMDTEYPVEHITKDLVKSALQKLTGDQMQVPPLFSAKSIDGGRAYKLARRGVEMELQPVPITINELELLSFDMPTVTLRIRCSKGTYVRSLARDLGVLLNSGAYLSDLRRTASGAFRVEDAMTLEIFEERLSLM